MTNIQLLKNAINSTGGYVEFGKKFTQYNSSLDFIEKNRVELCKKFDNKWIAVFKDKVQVSSDTYDELLEEIKKLNLPLDETAIKLISNRKIMALF
jgi:hypothetical protein